MLELYSDYLLSSFSYTTATGLAALTDGAVSHDQVTRFLRQAQDSVLASGDFDSKALWQLVKPLVRKVAKTGSTKREVAKTGSTKREVEHGGGVLIVDDTVEEKPYTAESELVCWHYDHSQGKRVKGINIVNVLYEIGGMRIPVAFAAVEKSLRVRSEQKGRWQQKSAVSKNEQVRALLKVCWHNAIKFGYVLADTWYASTETMKMIHQLNKHFVMPVKSNRKVALSLAAKQQGNYQRVSSLVLEADTVIEVYLEQLDFPLLLAKQVFTNEDGQEGVLYLVTDDVTLDYAAITTLYQRRWSVETFHKSLKSNASLTKSPAKTSRTQKNHIFCAIYAFVKLERLSVLSQVNHFALRSRVYLKALQASFGELRRLQFEAAA